jgi:isoquinoline 1-oxidoreductase alpha subunit
MKYKLMINGQQREVDVAADTPLLWVLREELELTGTKYGCGIAECGACTVYVDGEPWRSCSMAVSEVGDSKITTIEGLNGSVAAAVQEAWDTNQVPQCGYCQPGQVMAATALLADTKSPNDDDIDEALAGNLCRCATYPRIRRAVHDAAKKLEGGRS